MNERICRAHSSSSCAAHRFCLVSTWWTLGTLWRMFLDRGLPGKINLRLTSSASGSISWPHHLTQCSYHKHKHHAWVAMQEKGTLFGVLSEGKTKEVRKKSKTPLCWPTTDWFLNINLLGLHLLSLELKRKDKESFCTLFIWNSLTVSCVSVWNCSCLAGEANSSWNWFALNDSCDCSTSVVALLLSRSPALNRSVHVWWLL